MTAPLAGALLYISQSGSALTGGLALFALGLGMGLPLLAIAVFGARILPRPGAWMDRVKAVFGYRSEEHTSELQSLMRISYAVFCLKKKNSLTTQLYL